MSVLIIFSGLFSDHYIDTKHRIAIDYKYRFNLYDQLREFDGILYYSYWNIIEKTKLRFNGWYKSSMLQQMHYGTTIESFKITLYPYAIHIGGTKETPYLILENTAHNIGLLRSYAVT